ncbi:HD domain-containing protein [Candidatus Woesearchaeota archaeon]|nr:HD domain-containing protein [Candidatus Woesearchaeota archaeon]
MSYKSEKEAFEDLQLWKPSVKIFPPKALFDPKARMYPLFCYLYAQVRSTYTKVHKRKNGQNPFVHPLNVVYGLREAEIKDETTLCAGLIHDLIEERVDIYKSELITRKTKKETILSTLAEFERKTYHSFEEEILNFCNKNHLPLTCAKEILTITKLLTRHKRHFYYKSLSQIFQHPDANIREKAIQIKLADRLHNILTIEKFDNHQRIYECFKNLFILNNVKKFIVDKYKDHMVKAKRHNSTELLFKRCGKATYEAFLNITLRCSPVLTHSDVKTMIHLAFKKYALEKRSIWEITHVDSEQYHLYRIFQGVVRKYDARLHQEWDVFEMLSTKEHKFCSLFFKTYKFKHNEIESILDYKDAYALGEVITYLLYIPDYYLADFLCVNLTHSGRLRR